MLNPERKSVRMFKRWAFTLAVMLVLGQILAAAHEHSADSLTEDGCLLCLYMQQSSGILPTVAAALPAVFFHIAAVAVPGRISLPASVYSVRTRAPPFLLL